MQSLCTCGALRWEDAPARPRGSVRGLTTALCPPPTRAQPWALRFSTALAHWAASAVRSPLSEGLEGLQDHITAKPALPSL